MKPSLSFFLCLVFCHLLAAQSNKFSLGLEYSPNFTRTTLPSPYYNGHDGGYRFAQSIFLKGGYKVMDNLYLTGSLGYYNTREYVNFNFADEVGIDRITSERFHAYVATPVGLTYYMGPFFVSPEIGIGWNTGNCYKDHFYYSDGSQVENSGKDENNLYKVNSTTYPIFLSFGNEIKMKNCSVLLGVKGYYSLNLIGQANSNTSHYYGIGLVTGVKF